jgi:hypothetical protein
VGLGNPDRPRPMDGAPVEAVTTKAQTLSRVNEANEAVTRDSRRPDQHNREESLAGPTTSGSAVAEGVSHSSGAAAFRYAPTRPGEPRRSLGRVDCFRGRPKQLRQYPAERGSNRSRSTRPAHPGW